MFSLTLDETTKVLGEFCPDLFNNPFIHLAFWPFFTHYPLQENLQFISTMHMLFIVGIFQNKMH